MYIKLRTNSTISIHKLPLTIGSHASIIIKKPSIKPIHFKLTSNSHTIYGSDCQFDGRIIKIKGITIEIVEYISKNDINKRKGLESNVLRNENCKICECDANELRNVCKNDSETNVLRSELSEENVENEIYLKDTNMTKDHVILKDESMIIDCYGNVTVFEKSVDSKENEWISTSSIIDVTKEPKNASEECKKRRIDSTEIVKDNSIKDAFDCIPHSCITNIYNTNRNTNPNPNPSHTNDCKENVNEECIDTKNELQSMHELSKNELQDNLQNINTTQSSCIQENKMHPTDNSNTTDNFYTSGNLDAPDNLYTNDNLDAPDLHPLHTNDSSNTHNLYPLHTHDPHPLHTNTFFHDNTICHDNSLLYSNFQTNTPIFTDQSQNTPVKETVLYKSSTSSFMKDKKLKRSVQRLKTKDNQGIEEYPIERKAIDLKEVTVPVDENGNECSSSYVSVGEVRVMKRGSLNEKVNDTYIKNSSKIGENEKVENRKVENRKGNTEKGKNESGNGKKGNEMSLVDNASYSADNSASYRADNVINYNAQNIIVSDNVSVLSVDDNNVMNYNAENIIVKDNISEMNESPSMDDTIIDYSNVDDLTPSVDEKMRRIMVNDDELEEIVNEQMVGNLMKEAIGEAIVEEMVEEAVDEAIQDLANNETSEKDTTSEGTSESDTLSQSGDLGESGSLGDSVALSDNDFEEQRMVEDEMNDLLESPEMITGMGNIFMDTPEIKTEDEIEKMTEETLQEVLEEEILEEESEEEEIVEENKDKVSIIHKRRTAAVKVTNIEKKGKKRGKK